MAHTLGKRKGNPQDLLEARADLIAQVILYRSPMHFNSALKRLEGDAHKAESASAAAWSDVAAGYLVTAQRQDDPTALFAALAAANQALAADSRYPEARFNQALALEYLGLESLARDAWRHYLDIDSNSDWAKEAHQHSTRLMKEAEVVAKRTGRAERLAQAANGDDRNAAAELARIAPERARRLIQREILPRWGQAGLTGDEITAGRELSTARAAIVSLRSLDGDNLLIETLAAIEGVAGDPARLDALRRGHRDFGSGMKLLDDGRPDLARPLLDSARTMLAAGRSPFANWTILYLAVCEYKLNQLGISVLRLKELADRRGLDRTPALKGRVLWQLALAESIRGDTERNVHRLAQAAVAFRLVGDRESLAAIEDLMASVYDVIGDHGQSWRHRYLALRDLRWMTDTRRRWVVVKNTAEGLVEAGRPRFALPIFDELVRISSDNPEALAQALLRRSAALASLGQRTLAERDHRAAAEAVQRIEAPSLRARIRVDLLVSRAAALAPSDPQSAFRLLDEGRRFYLRGEHEILLARVLLARARAATAAGLVAEAEHDFGEALARAERRFGEIENESLKIAFLGELQSAFEDLLFLQQDRAPEAAFATAERARTRILLDRAGARPLTAAEVRAALPAGTVLVEYALVRDRLVIWALTRNGFSYTTVDWKSAGGADLVSALSRDIAARTEDRTLHQHLARLHDLLIRPVKQHLPKGSSLVFIPHGDLGSVPFSALLDRTAGRYLIEDYPLMVAPSASLHVAALQRARALRGQAFRTLLAVGDPAFDRHWHSNLSPLEEARKEVASIAPLYGPGGLMLVGESATPRAVASAARGRDVLHFAAHALTDAAKPERSALVLAPMDLEPSSGDLTAAEIERLPLARTQLAVLASCGGASGPVAAGEGVLSLARSFHAAGVPTVVAGLWRIDDKVAADFFIRFHKKLRQGDDPATALRKTQLEFVLSTDDDHRSPRAWAGTQVLGAVDNK